MSPASTACTAHHTNSRCRQCDAVQNPSQKSAFWAGLSHHCSDWLNDLTVSYPLSSDLEVVLSWYREVRVFAIIASEIPAKKLRKWLRLVGHKYSSAENSIIFPLVCFRMWGCRQVLLEMWCPFALCWSWQKGLFCRPQTPPLSIPFRPRTPPIAWNAHWAIQQYHCPCQIPHTLSLLLLS